MRSFTPATLLGAAIGLGVLAGAVALFGIAAGGSDAGLRAALLVAGAVFAVPAGFLFLVATIGLGVELGVRAAAGR